MIEFDQEVMRCEFIVGAGGDQEDEGERSRGLIELRIDGKPYTRWVTKELFEDLDEACDAAKDYFTTHEGQLRNALTEQLVYSKGKLVTPHELVFEKIDL